jgi:4-hydroxy-2-oxoheptanedioate aldolase
VYVQDRSWEFSLALGCAPNFDDDDLPVAQAIDFNMPSAQAHGVVAAIHTGRPDVARVRIAKGFRFVTVASNARPMAAGAEQEVAAMRA